jgi:hypothetical protein
MMRRNRLFSNVGDKIEGFFGVNVHVAGVLSKTGTSLDMMHVLPLAEGGLKR